MATNKLGFFYLDLADEFYWIIKSRDGKRYNAGYNKQVAQDFIKILNETYNTILASSWIDVKGELLPNDGEFILCFGNHQYLNDIFDLYNEKKLDKSQLIFWLNPVLSVQYRLIDGLSCWLYPNVLDGGLIDLSDSVTHWMPLPPPANQ